MTKADNLHQIDIKIMLRAYHPNIRLFSKCECVDSCEVLLESGLCLLSELGVFLDVGLHPWSLVEAERPMDYF